MKREEEMQLTTATAALAVLLLVQAVDAHVLLTFPPARYPQYDYLDNYRKGGPCGVAGKMMKSCYNFGL